MSKTPLQRFWSLLSLYKKQISQIYAYALLIGLVNLSLPLGIQSVINYIQVGQITFSWALLIVVVLIGIAFAGIMQLAQMRIVESIQHDLFSRSALEFAFRIPKFNLLSIDERHVPELVNRFFDTMTIQKGIPKILIDFSAATFQIIFGLILLSLYSPYFIFLGVVLFLFIGTILKFTGSRGLALSLKESKYKYKIAHWLEEIAGNNKAFKFYAESQFHVHKTDDLVVDYLEAREAHFQILLQQLKQFIGLRVFLAAGLLIAGSILVIQSKLNIGQFVAAEILIILIINSLEKIIRSAETIYDVLTGLEKIGQVLDLPMDKTTGSFSPQLSEGLSVALNHVTFKFPNNTQPIIRDLSFALNPGEFALLEGRAGTGKTTLIKLLAGLYEVQDGQIFFNQIPINHFQPDFIHNTIGVYFSTNELFNGTIRENVTMGFDVDENYLNELMNIMNLFPVLAKYKQGLNEQLDTSGRRLPKSAIQKLLLVRALIHKPRLLLLDNPLSECESKERQRIVQWLVAHQKQWTIIVSSELDEWQKLANQTIKLA